MPVIAHRAAEQREGAEWAARSSAFSQEMRQNMIAGSEPSARVELTSLRTSDGLRARGTAPLFDHAGTHAMLVEAALRGPLAPNLSTTITPQADAPDHGVNSREARCLSQAIYYEARGETRQGQVAVAEVIMNRVRSPAYPDTVCSVVYQGSHRTTGCQFTFTCDGSLNRRPRGVAWERAQQVATAVLQGYTRPVTHRATHYHTTGVNPIWNAGLVETTRIGTHIFYRFPNASERPVYQAALAQRRASSSWARAARSTDRESGVIAGAEDVQFEEVSGTIQPSADATPAIKPDEPIATAPAAGEVST
jgi:hypothetical protein